ncbi:MAG: serine/threonine protein kinase [Labilithrix sp.]|nr:serine/threonine protein kinase [Labilithrix sp.]
MSASTRTATAPDASDRDAAAPERRGSTLARYVLLDVLGQGGMGVVYSAFDPRLDRKIAIKVLRRRVGGEEPEDHERLLREAQAMARLSHPNVVAVHDVGTFEGSVFVAMEFVEGTTLGAWLETVGAERPWSARLAMLKAAGRGLAAAHAAGLVHRDFKPDNVLVGLDGRPRVTDFGIARSTLDGAEEREPSRAEASPSDEGRSAALATPLTETGSILGTVGYMAPEQAAGEGADARSDQFGFSATLYVALYGEKPFPNRDLEGYLEAIGRPVRDAPAGSRVPPWLRQVVLRGLSEAPDERYPSMDALLAALERDPGATRRRWIAVGALIAGVALAGAGVHASTQRRAHACVDALPPLAGVWDDDVKRDVRDAFIATGAPDAADSFARAAKALDVYATTWTSARTAACEATRVRHDEPEEVYQLRAGCLDRQKVQLRALTSLFRRADAQIVGASVKASYELPALSWCADVKELRTNLGLPDDPAKRGRVEEARQAIAEANVLALGDKNREALVIAGRALVLARDAAHESTEAEALYLVGWVQTRLVDDAAQRSLANAAWAGISSRHYAVVVRASALVAYITGVELQQRSEARDWLARANAALGALGGDDELEAFVASREASILHSLDHRPELALPLAERAVRTYRERLGAHPRTERELLNLGNMYVALGRVDVALATYEEALAMCESLYGPESFRTGVAAAHVGDAELKRGHIAEGTRLLERALGIAVRHDNTFWIVAALQELTQAANRRGDPKEALALGERGLALLDKPDASPVLVPASYVTTADALLALGRPAEALAYCDRALAAQEKTTTLAPDNVYEWDALRCRGEALLATRRPGEAVATLERSVSLTRREWPGDLARARFALARALVESHGDEERARILATQARDELALRAEAKTELAVIDAWRAAHGGS